MPFFASIDYRLKAFVLVASETILVLFAKGEAAIGFNSENDGKTRKNEKMDENRKIFCYFGGKNPNGFFTTFDPKKTSTISIDVDNRIIYL